MQQLKQQRLHGVKKNDIFMTMIVFRDLISSCRYMQIPTASILEVLF